MKKNIKIYLIFQTIFIVYALIIVNFLSTPSLQRLEAGKQAIALNITTTDNNKMNIFIEQTEDSNRFEGNDDNTNPFNANDKVEGDKLNATLQNAKNQLFNNTDMQPISPSDSPILINQPELIEIKPNLEGRSEKIAIINVKDW